MKKKFLALMTAFALVIGLGLAGAVPSSADAGPNSFVARNLGGAYQQTMQVKFFDGTTTSIATNSFQSSTQGLGNKSLRQIYTPPGKCIWEELWGNGGKTWWGNFNHGQNGSGWWELKGWSQRDAAGLESRLRWINCP